MQRPTITPFDLDILRSLEAACREFQVGRSAEFVRPAEVSRTKGVSQALTRLFKRGLIVRRPRKIDRRYSAHPDFPPSVVCWEYQINDVGREFLVAVDEKS